MTTVTRCGRPRVQIYEAPCKGARTMQPPREDRNDAMGGIPMHMSSVSDADVERREPVQDNIIRLQKTPGE
eukprot:3658533-Pyramimonas_sp.AAC.1